MEQAFASIENHDLPSVVWRLYATAAQLHLQIQDFDTSDRHCLQAASSLNRAAASFGENDPLRRSLLGAAETLRANFRRELDSARSAVAGK
jgi:hypothetical protein